MTKLQGIPEQIGDHRTVVVTMGWGVLERAARVAAESCSRAHGGLPFLVLDERDRDAAARPANAFKTAIWDFVPPWCQRVVYVDADTFTRRPWVDYHVEFGAVSDTTSPGLPRLCGPSVWSPHYNAGVFVAMRTPRVLAMFDRWAMLCALPLGLDPWFLDEDALARATRDCAWVRELPDEANWMVGTRTVETALDGACIHWAGLARNEIDKRQALMTMPSGPSGPDLRTFERATSPRGYHR